MSSQEDRLLSRRQEYAEATWQAVVTAARELFGEAGYSRTTVQQIARRARVSPATVYAQCGGKQGLLKTLMDEWTAGPLVREIIEACAAAGTADTPLPPKRADARGVRPRSASKPGSRARGAGRNPRRS